MMDLRIKFNIRKKNEENNRHDHKTRVYTYESLY